MYKGNPMPINSNCNINSSAKIFIPELVNIYGCTIGPDTTIGPFVEIQSDVIIGSNCSIQSHTFICQYVYIGDNVFIGHGVMFTNDKNPKSHNKDWIAKPTYVQDDVSIGTGAIILPGITLGKGCVIGAGAVVTKDVKSGTTMVGNPAKVLDK